MKSSTKNCQLIGVLLKLATTEEEEKKTHNFYLKNLIFNRKIKE
jgi:hypothetical protein